LSQANGFLSPVGISHRVFTLMFALWRVSLSLTAGIEDWHIGGTDIVAVDAVDGFLMGIDPQEVMTTKLGYEAGQNRMHRQLHLSVLEGLRPLAGLSADNGSICSFRCHTD